MPPALPCLPPQPTTPIAESRNHSAYCAPSPSLSLSPRFYPIQFHRLVLIRFLILQFSAPLQQRRRSLNWSRWRCLAIRSWKTPDLRHRQRPRERRGLYSIAYKLFYLLYVFSFFFKFFIFTFQVLARKAKNQYTWKGFSAIPEALQELKVFLLPKLSRCVRLLVFKIWCLF